MKKEVSEKPDILVNWNGEPVSIRHGTSGESHPIATSFIGEPYECSPKPCVVCFTRGWNEMYIAEVFPSGD